MRTWIFEIRPWRKRSAVRRVELAEDQTLHDLHGVIQEAFELGDDHLYAFYLNNSPDDLLFEYGGPGVRNPRHQALETRLADLPLKVNKRFLYVFDFGDDLRHEVRVIGPGEADGNADLPRIVASTGDAPPQYAIDNDGPASREVEGWPSRRALPRDLAELATALREEVARWARALRDDTEPWDEAGPPAEAGADRQELLPRALDLVSRLLAATGPDGDLFRAVLIEAGRDDTNVVRWVTDIPQWLLDTGRAQDAAELALRLHGSLGPWYRPHGIPKMLAMAGRFDEARPWLDRGLEDDPDAPEVLVDAARACRLLGEPGRAEGLLHRAAEWAGSDRIARFNALKELESLLKEAGREDEVAPLWAEDRRLDQEIMRQRARRRGLEAPETVRREEPKVGRNDPCPCGSGKKFKKCCLGNKG